MKKIFTLFLVCLFILTTLIACTTKETDLISSDMAKSILLEHNPDAIITDCTFNENTFSYTITFKTSLGVYVGSVGGFDGKLTSVSVQEEKPEITEFETYPEEEPKERFITMDTALAIAISNSGASGTAIVVKTELDKNEKVFTIIFRSGEFEYSYIIDAVTGDIISSDAIPNS